MEEVIIRAKLDTGEDVDLISKKTIDKMVSEKEPQREKNNNL